MTTPTAEPSTAAPRPRGQRRPLDELSLAVDAAALAVASTGDPDWLAQDRAAAFHSWASLPGESNLLYTPYIDLRAARLDAARLAPRPATSSPAANLPTDADGLLETVEGIVTGAALSAEAAAAGVRLTTFAELLAADPAHARTLLEGVGSLPGTDKFAQLTRALWAQAVVLDIPAGVRLVRPVIIRWRLGASDRALLTRTLVHLGEGAEASLVEEFVEESAEGPGTGQSFFAGTMEVSLERAASLTVASLQELPDHLVAFQHRHAEIGEDASLHWAMAQLGGRLVRSRVDNRLAGDRSSVEQVEIVFGSDEQLFDLTSYTTHIGRDTTGDLLSKGALLDRARSYMKGLITIDKSAVGTDSFLGEFGMNLSKSTRSVAIPSLEIDQPDCRRAAHSSSVGPIDETQLFYLESRGIPPDEARKFIVLGFLEPVVARVPLASAQGRLRELLEAKWATGVGGGAKVAA
ncbi:MAG: SufD family Fe-S cluster assembly protein [Chloroflexota bacterium]|jgi:Fe-S cluster assembly scaffold protein SufB|nr:SufD family Fe-S cluster assembly protein [Chloroflexota bacterium]MDH5242700.1 SufD family Fe-S cluster assembly protein [Chloroflexota bacterium]